MSREHMIYTQTAIKPTEAKASNVANWNPSEWITPESGVLLEGKIKGRYRHTLTDSKNQKYRYTIITLEMTSAYRREFGADGNEIAIMQGKSKKISTGFLQSSYKEIQVEESGKLTAAQVREMIGKTPLASLGQPTSGETFEIWGEEDTMEKIDFFRDEPIRVKTRGNTPLVEFIGKIDEKNATISNFGGDQTSGTWTDKLMSNKGKSDSKAALPQDKLEGVADSEWD